MKSDLMKSVEIFAGGGGLALGLSLAGFSSKIVVEWDKWACDTLRENKAGGYPLLKNWDIHQMDVRDFDFSQLNQIDLVSGGPPCQPFSLGGKHKGYSDERDMFPVAARVIEKLRPKAFIFENVKGLTRKKFEQYLGYIKLQLSHPEFHKKESENWEDHHLRLVEAANKGEDLGLGYDLFVKVLNAADYGVPQRRERVFFVGFRKDLEVNWSFPIPTHSFNSLLVDQWVTGEYWKRHEIPAEAIPKLPRRFTKRVEKLKQRPFEFGSTKKPWRTVRDGLKGLPNPHKKASTTFFNHVFQSGAKVYPGHTGSPLDMPAKTLKAGNHGVPGGENMMILPDGSVRYFTVREAARMQTFPDCYKFHGSWTETMRQLGNAVPVRLAQMVGSSVAENILEFKFHQLKNQKQKSEKRQTVQPLG